MIGVCCVIANPKDFKDEAVSWSSLNVDNEIQRARDICLNRAVRYFHPAL